MECSTVFFKNWVLQAICGMKLFSVLQPECFNEMQ